MAVEYSDHSRRVLPASVSVPPTDSTHTCSRPSPPSSATRTCTVTEYDFSSITTPKATNLPGKDLHSPYVAAKMVADFACGDKKRRSATLKYVVSKEWVPIKDRMFHEWVQKFEQGNLKQDARWLKRRATDKVSLGGGLQEKN